MLENIKIGFIGAGNMGGAIIGGLINSKKTLPHNIYACDLSEDKLAPLKEQGVNTTQDTEYVCQNCGVVILAVKPNAFDKLLPQIRSTAPIYVSIAAGVSLGYLENNLPKGAKAVRAMPNTPALIGNRDNGRTAYGRGCFRKRQQSRIRVYDD